MSCTQNHARVCYILCDQSWGDASQSSHFERLRLLDDSADEGAGDMRRYALAVMAWGCGLDAAFTSQRCGDSSLAWLSSRIACAFIDCNATKGTTPYVGTVVPLRDPSQRQQHTGNLQSTSKIAHQRVAAACDFQTSNTFPPRILQFRLRRPTLARSCSEQS